MVAYLQKNIDKKIPNLGETFRENITRQLTDENDSRSLEKYLSDMLKTSQWGGQSEIIALSMYLKRNILVYIKQGKYYVKHGGFVYDDKNDNIIITNDLRGELVHICFIAPSDKELSTLVMDFSKAYYLEKVPQFLANKFAVNIKN